VGTSAAGTGAAGVHGIGTGFGQGVLAESANDTSGVTALIARRVNAGGTQLGTGFAIHAYGGGSTILAENNNGTAVWATTNGLTLTAAVRGIINPSADDQSGAIYGDAAGSFSVWAGKFIGDVEARGFYNSSDRRLKKDIKDAAYGLPELMKLHPVSYKWKDGKDNAEHNGLIAQDVQKIFPSAVRTGGKEKTLTVDYVSLLPVAIRAIQQQQATIEQQQARIAELEKRSGPLAASMFTPGMAIAALALLPFALFFARRRQNTKA
jgi:hypothetical protein